MFQFILSFKRISRVAIIAGVVRVISIILVTVTTRHWKTAREFAAKMRIAKELNTGPEVL